MSARLKRLSTLVSILSRYGFKDVLARMNLHPDNSGPENGGSVYYRIRMVLQELGPTFVKLGQAFSNREDMLPRGLIEELQYLQDDVALADILLDALLEQHFGSEYQQAFRQINPEPMAAASIAQIYRATLADGAEVVLKIKRPGIDEVIAADLMLMKDLARLLCKHFDFARDIELEQAVLTFEKSLIGELSLLNERRNLERFAENFKNHPHTYVPRVYPHLSDNEVLCMEFVRGGKITDTAFHQAHQLDPAVLAERGFQLLLSQILDYGFFHADPHAGNIMLLPDGRIVFIDLGAVGSIYPSDQEHLEDLILYLATQNAEKLIALLKKMALRIEVKNEVKLRDDISGILRMIHETPLDQLNLAVLLGTFKDILFENRVVMPEYFTILARGLVLIESVGRNLNPQLNIAKSLEPFVLKVMQKRLSPRYLLDKGFTQLRNMGQDVWQIPVELRQLLHQLHAGELTIKTRDQAQEQRNQILQQGFRRLSAALLGAALILGAALLFAFNAAAVVPAWVMLVAGVGVAFFVYKK